LTKPTVGGAPKGKEVVHKEQNMENKDVGFLDDVAGQGYGNLSGDAFATPFIKLLQSNSTEVTSELPGAKPGVFFDVARNQVLGNTLKVIPIDFEILWLEWEKDMGGLKGKYLPHSIPSVGDKFNRKNPETGRDLVDSWLYYVLLEGRESEGVAILSLPVSSIKYLKAWNTMNHHTKLPSGKDAPFYSSVWELGPTEKERNDSGQVWYNIGGAAGPAIKRVDFITKEIFTERVKPAIDMAHNVMLSYQQTLPAPVAQKALPESPKPEAF